MLALVPCIGPFISLLLGISFLNPATSAAKVAVMVAAPGLTAAEAVFLAAIF